MVSGKKVFRLLDRVWPSVCLAVVLLLTAPGCGGDEEQVITIDIQPSSLSFDSEDNMYFVDQYFYASVLKWTPSGKTYDLAGILQPPGIGGFLPWGLEVGTGATALDDVLFVTDRSTANPSNRLLAVNPDLEGDPGLDNVLLGQTSGPSGTPFRELRAVAALYRDDPVKSYRVFVADHDPEGVEVEKIQVADYDLAGKTFTFSDPITLEAGTADCPDAFVDTIGLAVDPDHNALFAVDQGNNALYRFSGIHEGGTVNCDQEREYWKTTEDLLYEPRGVAYLPGTVTPPQKNYIALADSKDLRVTAFTWNGTDFLAENLPDNFEPFPGGMPADVAFSQEGDLWATYPLSSAIAGPEMSGTP